VTPPHLTGQTSVEEQIHASDTAGLGELEKRLRDNPGQVDRALAGVDDATVLGLLRHASLVLHNAPDPGRNPDVMTAVERFRTYSDAALFRRKNFAIAWKTQDEYEALLRKMAPRTVAELDRMAEAVAQAEEEAEAASKVRQTSKRFAEAISVDAVDGMSLFLDYLLPRPGVDDYLRTELDRRVPRVREHRGFWDLSYSSRARPSAVELYVSEQPRRLNDTSPLARAVTTADRRRMRLSLFFFFADHAFVGDDEHAASTYRANARKRLEEELPAILGLASRALLETS